MLRHIVIAAFRNLAANKLVSAIAILGLSAGIATALLMALVVQSQLSFDHFIPGHERTYRLFWRSDSTYQCVPGSAVQCQVPHEAKAELLRLPAVESVSGLILFPQPKKFRRGAITGWERLFAADPEFFAVMPFPAAYGVLKDALVRPGGIVIDRSTARKYFSRDDILGRTLTVEGRPLTVRAVIEDLPRRATNLESGLFISWRDAMVIDQQSAQMFKRPQSNGYPHPIGRLYLRLKPGAVLTQDAATQALWNTAFLRGLAESRRKANDPPLARDASLLRLDRINAWEFYNPGIGLRLGAAILTGALVLLIAAINFINLTVARAARRAKEVAIRKSSGGGRFALILQFLGEALVTVSLAMVIGVALTEWLLPFANAHLDTGAALAWNEPLLLPALLLSIILLALVVGAWPALVLSGFRPIAILRGPGQGGHAALARGALVTLQFSILIVLAIAGAVMWLQRDFAARQALRVDSDQMLLLRLGVGAPSNPKDMLDAMRSAADMLQPRACPPALVDRVRKLPGVRGAVCADDSFLNSRGGMGWYTVAGVEVEMGGHVVDPRIFALYSIRPLAGFLPGISGGDAAIRRTGTVINLSASRMLGFASPRAALGKSWITAVKDMRADFRKVYSEEHGQHAVITAVVPDFSFATVRTQIQPALYTPWTGVTARTLHVKLDGQAIPETLAAIDSAFAQSGIDRPLDRFFLDDHMQGIYRDVTRDAQFFTACAVIAILLACMGLVGIAVSTAERRTKEIGVRKAMGASSLRVVLLLLWRFSLPVLLANIIAWPVAWWLMQRWLAGFAYRIDLSPWFFAATSGTALLLALLTVAGQAIQAARQKPVLALRYE